MAKKFIFLFIFLVVVVALALFWPVIDWQSANGSFIFWQIRLPRIILAVLVGASLTLAGLIYQTIFKNPLAEPYLLGVSSGAALGAATAIILGLAASFWAFVGGILAVFVVFFTAWKARLFKIEKLILLGVGISALFTAFLTLTIILSDQLRAIYFWLLGSLVNASWEIVGLVSICFLLVFILTLFCSKQLDILRLNEEEAYSLGVNVFWTRVFLLFLATALTAVSVSFTGIVGFVGLLGPHLARLIFGHRHQGLILGGIFTGAVFLLLADFLARILLYPTEIPLGVVTAVIGAPYFIILLLKSEK